MKQSVLLALALIAGFLGGVLSPYIVRSGHPTPAQSVVRARQFELLNDNGEVVSFWGTDKWEQVVLAFGRGKRSAPGGLENIGNQRAMFGLDGNGSGLLCMRTADGQLRVSLQINEFQQPTLIMDDEAGARMGLGWQTTDTPGIRSDNWGLAFDRERESTAYIGVSEIQKDGKRYHSGVAFVNGERVLTGPPE